MKTFVLSTGRSTTKIQEYIIDLFKLYLGINPGDIPGLPNFGFNFTFAGIPKCELYDKMEFRINAFVDNIKKSFPNNKIEISELAMPSEETVKLTLTVDGTTSDSIFLNIYSE